MEKGGFWRQVKLSRMGRLALLLLALLALIYFARGQGGDTFFGKSEEETCEGESCEKSEGEFDSSNSVDREGGVAEKKPVPSTVATVPEINVIITFTNAVSNPKLKQTFTVTVRSILQQASVPLAIHIIGEDASQKLASKIIKENAGNAVYRMVHLDVDKLARELDEIVKPMQKHFSYKPGAYYNHALFFLSIAIHKVLPESMDRVIMLDADLKFKADIKELYQRFDLFEGENVIGIGRDMQPVYRHTFWQYRKENPGTRVGNPPPDGLTGFNSGVLLLDLDRMRKSTLYNSLINADSVQQLTEEFHFKGHLGDQDFFSLLSMKYENLFHVLPCTWNRQLCIWWKDKGYKDVFDQYFSCEGEIKIYHGNCGTPIPAD